MCQGMGASDGEEKTDGLVGVGLLFCFFCVLEPEYVSIDGVMWILFRFILP